MDRAELSGDDDAVCKRAARRQLRRLRPIIDVGNNGWERREEEKTVDATRKGEIAEGREKKKGDVAGLAAFNGLVDFWRTACFSQVCLI